MIEALLRLEQDGLVESEPNRGARVKEWTLETVENECMLREAIECQVARLVAEAAADRQFDDLEATARRLDSLMQRADPGSSSAWNCTLNSTCALAELAGYPLLLQQLRAAWVRRLMQVNWLNATIEPVPADWHQTLVTVLRRRDADAAEKAMREHVRYGANSLRLALGRLRPEH